MRANKGHVAAVGFLLTPSPEIALEGRENRKFEFEYYSTRIIFFKLSLVLLAKGRGDNPLQPHFENCPKRQKIIEHVNITAQHNVLL